MPDNRRDPLSTDKEAWAATWARRMADAQLETHVKVDGVECARIPYGADHPDIDVKSRCRDCGVAVGQLHVPTCCVERCPRCGVGQAIGGCGCADKQVTQ